MSDSGHLKRSHAEGTTSVEVSFPTKYSNWSDLVARIAELEAENERLKTMLKRKHVRWDLLMAERAIAEMSDGRDDD